MPLTEKQIPTLPPGRHTDSRGLYLLVGATTKTWQFKRRGRWVRIGHWPAWPAAAARARAQELAVQDDQGRPLGMDVRAAYERWKSMKELRSPRTFENNERAFRIHFADWHDRDLSKISRPDMDHRHAQIVRKSGPFAARNAIHAFASWWKQARRLDPMLPECPTVAVQVHRQRKIDETPLYNRLHEWHQSLTVIRSPVRRALYEMALLTGLRRESLRLARWEHLRGDMLHIPTPKRARGEAPRPFDVPMVDAHMAILNSLRALAAGSPFIFFGERLECLADVRMTKNEHRDWTGPTFTPHSLRRCFITAGVEAGVHPYALSLLVNHKVSGIDEHYVARGVDLRAAMAATVAVLLLRAGDGIMAPSPTSSASDDGS